MVNEFIRTNTAELKRIIAENDCDGIVIYEVYGVMALEMQFSISIRSCACSTAISK